MMIAVDVVVLKGVECQWVISFRSNEGSEEGWVC